MMDIIRAKEILTALADGINPIIGEVLPPEDSCNQPDVIRAIHTVLNFRKENETNDKSGKPWSFNDELLLCRMFDQKKSNEEICKALQRSSEGVAAKLVKLGKISSRADFRARKQ